MREKLAKTLLIVISLLAVFALAGCGTAHGSPSSPSGSSASAIISIKGPEEAGMILEGTKVEVKDGDTVIDVLLRAGKQKGIDVDYTGKGPSAYVSGIGNYYEFDYGPNSGWIWKKDGETPNKGAGTVKVEDGNRIEWVYNEDFRKKE